MKLSNQNMGLNLSDPFQFGGLTPALIVGGTRMKPVGMDGPSGTLADGCELVWHFAGDVDMVFRVVEIPQGYRILPLLWNQSNADFMLHQVTLLEANTSFSEDMVFLLQGNYHGKIASFTDNQKNTGDGEPNNTNQQDEMNSDLVSICYDRKTKQALLSGFLTSERFCGKIGYDKNTIRVYFDGGDTLIPPSAEPIAMEAFCFLSGKDPQKLLEDYADLTIQDNPVSFPEKPVVSWCSWYPHRLSVSAERIIANAKAAGRLKPYGLSIIEADLGWEKDHLPGEFAENSRFSCGLAKVSEELNKLGFAFGVWKAPYTISEFDPLVKAHPEWLIQDETGKPMKYWEWFWKPNGEVYILDLTHPGAQQHLHEKMSGLYAKGVRYFKSDFINCASDPKARIRHNPYIAAGGTLEMARIGQRIIKEAMKDSVLLNCGGPEGPSPSAWQLLYACNDTGNTGFITFPFQYENLVNLAVHLFKNKKWGIIQPSCLCVGLPGTKEEAQIRATAAYMAGGQIDIGDDLPSLPEERWQILLSCLPQPAQSAKVIDLFEPLVTKKADYVKMVTGQADAITTSLCPLASAWKQDYKTDWAQWTTVALFSFGLENQLEKQTESRFTVPYSRLGLDETKNYVGFEFWSGQYLGELPGGRVNEDGYEHPGDYQELLLPSEANSFTVAFFGPAVKMIRITEKQPYPFVVGTTFHQSSGTELKEVKWDGNNLLAFNVDRPCGESGLVFVETCGREIVSVKTNGRSIPYRIGAKGSLVIPYTCENTESRIEIYFTC